MNVNVDITGVRLETERLILRPWQQSDLEDFYAYASEPDVGPMAGWNPHENLEKSQMILDLFIREKKTFALQLKESGKVIGSLGIEERDDELPIEYEALKGRELGYVLSKRYWGMGLMPEAVKAVIDYCFRELSYDYLACGHFEWNHQSRRVIEKCGFTYMQTILFTTRTGKIEKTRLYVLKNPK